ncbi:PREDICTED: LOW QUALITY PROTEIN: uncharacterized protein LOC105948627 [Erythranthe guttata]|uniref:LOW QUALITY PROTEIN: uncharacterized protein LOC105948627 n=1 Tax=Erythranthe guttata TaxID=4155 RepID=UPI00064DEA6F|nr:PREDICTED: LOW QUALITY PROTEIN: uncharacterized protein LOC105948627 [Erythranthe guttata]|eukprot:XP_012827301.1 PREDICTED: LOW QUALITY PROTEIN: uncharacterized protein LOC105948627 [Erythranthe guttata]
MEKESSSIPYWLKNVDEDEAIEMELAAIAQPETPNEPMEFLSRSWSLSANEITKALAKKKHIVNTQPPLFENINNLSLHPQTPLVSHHLHVSLSLSLSLSLSHTHTHTHTHTQLSKYIFTQSGNRITERIRGGPIGRLLFHHKEGNNNDVKRKKDKARMENAHTHAVLSVAGLAAALASAASAERSKAGPTSKMSSALTSATELLASYCIELAESSGADQDSVDSVVRSALAIQTASHLSTLTAAAATALRGEAALRERLPKEGKRSATISPYERNLADFQSQSPSTFRSDIEEDDLPCVGDLLQLTSKGNTSKFKLSNNFFFFLKPVNRVIDFSNFLGVLRWKKVSVYINKAFQVTMKLKSKHVGGAFSKNNKCIVYEVIDESDRWPFRKERENMEVYFGVKTAKGMFEFKCKNRVHKQKWCIGIQQLLQRRRRFEEAQNSLRNLNINNTI